MTSVRSASTSTARDPEPVAGSAAWRAAPSSAARTLATTAVAKPSSQLRRHARALCTRPGRGVPARPCHIWISSEVYRTSVRSMSEVYPNMWILVPGPVWGRMTHWQRRAAASPHRRWACTRAHGFSMWMTRSAGRSVSGRSAASRARSMPYFAISSAALAVSAWASAGVTPAASALTSSLRTRASKASGASVVTGVPPVLRPERTLVVPRDNG